MRFVSGGSEAYRKKHSEREWMAGGQMFLPIARASFTLHLPLVKRLERNSIVNESSVLEVSEGALP